MITIFFALLLMVTPGFSADPNNPDVKSSADANDSNGPMLMLSYDTVKPLKTPTSSFMYFIPLISPTPVSTQISQNNTQEAMFTSYDKNVILNSFTLTCEYELQGNGYFKDIFDPNGVIATFPDEIKRNAPVTNLLDYIMLEGNGSGTIVVKGTIVDSNVTVTRVEVHFGTKGQKSPVTIGLYSVKSENGQYKYEDKYNEIVARVATLGFTKTDGDPRMDIAVVSVNKASKPNSYVGRVKGFIVNFFIDPIKISPVGNDTMLKFGYALFNKQTSFTFPKAVNLKNQTVTP